jgi:hypothetical protein
MRINAAHKLVNRVNLEKERVFVCVIFAMREKDYRWQKKSEKGFKLFFNGSELFEF